MQPHVEEQTLRPMRLVALVMLSVGALVCATGLILTPLTPLGEAAQLTATVGFAVGALVVVLAGSRRKVLEVLAVACVLLLALLVGASNVVGTTPFFFLWPLVYLAYFSSLRTTASAYAVMGVCVVVAAAVNPLLQNPAETVVGVLSSVGLTSGLVAAMNRRQIGLHSALAQAANTDALTGLLNRRGFAPRLDALVQEARVAGRMITLATFDLDHFKSYNDTHGHLGGDRALMRFAEVLRTHTPVTSLRARLGGEEFAVIFEDTELAEARACVDVVLNALRADVAIGTARITASAGLCALDEDVTSSETLMRLADIALYDAKAAGRDRARCWKDCSPAQVGSATAEAGRPLEQRSTEPASSL
jgi:diguanylate cyclase (GGDEF)-like protein